MVSELFHIAYEVRQNTQRVKLPVSLDNHFSFSQVATGTTGGDFFRSETGFALLGKGKGNHYKNDLVLRKLNQAVKAAIKATL